MGFMKSALLRIMDFLSFCGTIIALILVLGFRVPLLDIYYIAISFDSYLSSYLCTFILFSVPISIIVYIMWVVMFKQAFPMFSAIVIPIDSTLWPPYKGLDIGLLIKVLKSNNDTSGIIHDLFVCFRNLIYTVRVGLN